MEIRQTYLVQTQGFAGSSPAARTMNDDPFNVRLLVPTLIDAEKCRDCEHRFVCWTNREREIVPVRYDFKKSYSEHDEFQCYI